MKRRKTSACASSRRIAREFEIRPSTRTGRCLIGRPCWPSWPTHLRIDRFRILGISGGAPYAYAAAWMIPERVEAIAVVSGAPPIAELDDRSGLLRFYNWNPGLA